LNYLINIVSQHCSTELAKFVMTQEELKDKTRAKKLK
jgi:hypothetical protein